MVYKVDRRVNQKMGFFSLIAIPFFTVWCWKHHARASEKEQVRERQRQYAIKQAALTGEKPNVPLEPDEWGASGYILIIFIVGFFVLVAIPI